MKNPQQTLKLIAIFLTLSLLSYACQMLPTSGDPSQVSSGGILFQDNFADPNSGWDDLPDSNKGALEYQDGKYRIYNALPYQMLWASPGLQFGDVHVEVDATQGEGPLDDNFGIICRSIDKDNFYFFTISADGYYGIGKVKKGIQQLLGMPAMPPSEVIRQGMATNHLRADCIGNELSFYVNDVPLSKVQDVDFPNGGVGLLAGTFATPGVEVYFDNLKVYKP
jgi:hypothetical protein